MINDNALVDFTQSSSTHTALESKGTVNDNSVKTNVLEAFGKLPLLFVENRGQVDSSVKYYARAAGQSIYLTPSGMAFDLIRYRDTESSDPGNRQAQRLVLNLSLMGANSGAAVVGREQDMAVVNYLIGNDPQKWHTDIPTYREVVYHDIYPAIDLRLYGKAGVLAYDFIVKPAATPDDIALAYNGIDSLTIEDGKLAVGTAFGDIKQGRPYMYQQIGDDTVAVQGGFRLLGANSYGFEVGAYDASYPLIIDPALVYSTFIGGSDIDYGHGIAVDSSGNAYITGYTRSSNFPTTAGVCDPVHNGEEDVFVAKLNASGSALVYSTFLGGSSLDRGNGIAVDGSGNAYVTGYTYSSDFPPIAGAYDTDHNGSADVFVTKLNASGSSLLYSTFLGGGSNDYGRGIAIDGSGNAFVTGSTASSDFPTPTGADTSHNGNYDVFVTKLNASGSSLVYSTFLGGSSDDSQLEGGAIAVDGSGNAYVTGYTTSGDFPTTTSAYDTGYNGYFDVFVTKLNDTGSSLVYSTFLGGSSNDLGYGIAIDGSGNAYVTGYTNPSGFPATADAYDNIINGNRDAFVTKLNDTGSSLVYSTFLGGSNDDYGRGIAVDGSGNAYVTGYTASSNFPTTIGAYDTGYNGGFADVFVTRLNASGNSLLYSTFIGGDGDDSGYGIVVDGSGNAYVTGYTFSSSSDFPTTISAYDTSHNGNQDVFVAKLIPKPPGITVSPTSGLTTTEAGGQATFTVVLDVPPSDNVTIGLSSDDTTEGTVSPSSLTFTSGNWDTPQTVTVTGVDDSAVDGNIAYTIITAAAVSGDSAYDGLDASDVGVTNNDNDTAVATDNATTVEEYSACFNGTITDDGGAPCKWRFSWGTTPGDYTSHCDWQTNTKETGQSFFLCFDSLTRGQKYYCIAQATNDNGTTVSSGNEVSFTTKPDAPTAFSATAVSTSQIDLSWTKGNGAQKTMVRRSDSAFPTAPAQGTQVYFETGNSHPDTGLSPSTTYYYSAWSWVEGSDIWSDTYATAEATTQASGPPSVPDVVGDYSTKCSVKFFDWKCNKWIVVSGGTLHITDQDGHKVEGYWEPDVSIEGWPVLVPVKGYVGPFVRDAKLKIKNTPRLSLVLELGEYCKYPTTKYVTYILNAAIKMDKKTEKVKSMKGTINGWGEYSTAFDDGSASQGQFEGKFTATPLPGGTTMPEGGVDYIEYAQSAIEMPEPGSPANGLPVIPDVEGTYPIKGSIKFFDWKSNKGIVVKSGTLHITKQDEHKVQGYIVLTGTEWPEIVSVKGYVGPFVRDAKLKIKNTPRLSLILEVGTYCDYPTTKYVTYVLNGKVKWDSKLDKVKSIKGTINGWGEWGPAFDDESPSLGQFEGKFTATPMP